MKIKEKLEHLCESPVGEAAIIISGTAALGIFEAGLRTICGEKQIDHLYTPYAVPLLGTLLLGPAAITEAAYDNARGFAASVLLATFYSGLGVAGINLLNYW